MEEMRNSHNVFCPEGKYQIYQLEYLGVNGKILLQSILKEYDYSCKPDP
jgi:hypothetical protein